MKKYRIFVLILAAMLLTGCIGVAPDSTEPPTTTESKPKPNIMLAWTGEYSKENRQKAIEEYRENYTPFVSGKESDLPTVSFETDFDIAEFGVSLLSKVDDRDVNIEMKKYIDLAIQTECDGRKIAIATDWWYGSGSNTKAYPIWSYLVYVKDTTGAKYYYYFRVQYSTPQNDAES